MRTRIFRALVCLVLVAALLVQVSPIQAKAAGNNFFYIDPELQLVSDLIGLGISVGTDAAAHNQVIQDAADWLAETGEWLSEGMLKVYKVAAAAGGFKYMVDGDFLQELFEWLWGAEVLTSSATTSSPGSRYMTVEEARAYAREFPYGYEFIDNDKVAFHISTEPISYSFNEDGELTFTATAQYWRWFENPGSSAKWVITSPGTSTYTAQKCTMPVSIGGGIVTDKDLTLNHVGAFGSILPEVYTEWFQNSTTITDSETGEEKTVVPIGLGQSVEETQGMTQEDIWAGTSSYVDTETDVGTGDDTIVVPESVTLKDILTGILSVPKSVAQAVSGSFTDVVTAVKAIPAAITDFFTIQSDVDALAVSWADFFPFCIPGDIRDLVLVFDAEPEAPHFVFDVDFPYMNEPWHIDLDFSEWDPVALVLRRLELLLFIVGLAMATRNYYIRG